MTVEGQGGSCWDSVERHTRDELFWMADPIVRERINRRISGDPRVWPLTWFKNRFATRLPLGRVLSVGCGLGNLEREIVRWGIASSVVGVDLAAAPLAQALQSASLEGMTDRIAYVRGDASALLRRPAVWDGVFFHGSLHHIADVPGVLDLVAAALKPHGLLYLDEFVGRSRDQWRWRHLILANLAYRLLPRSVRRTRIIRSPVTDEDPTEQIHSSWILREVEKRFRVIERRDYGGNLALLIYPSLRRPGPGGPTRLQLDRAVRRLLDLEDRILRPRPLFSATSFHTLIVAEVGAAPARS